MWPGSRSMTIGRCVPSPVSAEFKGDRDRKSKPIPDPHLVHGFLTTAANAIVE